MWYRNLILVAVLCGPSGLFADDWISVGSWNIKHFGDRDHGQHPLSIAQHIRLANVDVLALQEIYTTTAAVEKLDDVLELLSRAAGQTWKKTVLPNRVVDDDSQLVAVIWNEDRVKLQQTVAINVQHKRVQIGSEDARAWDRKPHALQFSTEDGKTDFALIPIHMKSNFDGQPLGRATRKQEATELVDELPRVTTVLNGEKDIIVIGDTNCVDASEAALGVLKDAGFRDLNALDATTYEKGEYKSPFDRALVASGPESREFRYSRQYVLRPANAERHLRKNSDHFVIKIAIQMIDDDD